MKKLFTSTLLTVAAVPFLMAAPTVAKKVQTTQTSAASSKTAPVKKVQKKSVKKTQTKAAAPSAPAQK